MYVKAYREFESLSFRNVLRLCSMEQKITKKIRGFSSDLTKRLAEHNSGKSPFTKIGIPWIMIYSEKFATKSQARSREKFLKSGVGRKFLDSLLKRKDAGVSASG